ncbi:MAG: NADH-quinone oxidoreductase subunit NuoH [candidate division WOR-3 bacterium]|nr:NADH-quinone oxidoreductase subunit NuoH [candidate division WOR-3 bacterium]
MLLTLVILPIIIFVIAFGIFFVFSFILSHFTNFYIKSFLELLVILIAAPISAILVIYTERKFAARLHSRIGPYLVGRPHGYLQLVADALKMLMKEDSIPKQADKFIFNLSPIIFTASSILAFSVIPLSEKVVFINWDLAILFLLAVGSIPIISSTLAGWSSNSKYPMISAIRTAGVLLAYEIPLVLSILSIAVLANSFNLIEIVKAQSNMPFILIPIIGQISFIVFLLCALAETNKAPFDIPEAESELVSGVNVEYSGMKFGLFYLGEYLFTVVNSLLITLLFLGGWHGPKFLPDWAWTILKAYFVYLLLLLIRWSYMRLRLDQLIELSWKWLIPISFVNLILAILYRLYIGG